MTIYVTVEGKHAYVTGAPTIVCGNSDYKVQFSFDEDWKGAAAKTARFVYLQNGLVKYTDVVFTGDLVDVPVLTNTKEVLIGAFAGNLRTTTPARVPCELSIRCGTGAPVDPTPSQYDQIMALLNTGGSVFETDETLTLKNGVLSVNRATEPDPDSTLPITAAAVAASIGNIEVVLKTI